jgi:hypothetical protein
MGEPVSMRSCLCYAGRVGAPPAALIAMSDPQRPQKPTHLAPPLDSTWQKFGTQAPRAFDSMNREGAGVSTGVSARVSLALVILVFMILLS